MWQAIFASVITRLCLFACQMSSQEVLFVLAIQQSRCISMARLFQHLCAWMTKHVCHRVGALLLKGDWQGAINLILAPSSDDRDDNAAARKLYTEGRNARAALKALPRHFTAERALLEVRKFF